MSRSTQLHVATPATMRRLVIIAAVLFVSCKDAGAPASRFTITPDDADLFIGGTQQFTALGARGNVLWASDNDDVATVVPQTGFVTARARGQTTIRASSGRVTAAAQVNVLAPPALVLSSYTVNFAGPVGTDPEPATVTITNSGDAPFGALTLGTVVYGAGQPTGWLSTNASGSTPPVTVTLSVQSGGLARGVYTATVPVLATGATNSPQNIAVTFALETSATIAASHDTISFSAFAGATPQAAQTVQVTSTSSTEAITGLSVQVAYSGSTTNWLTAQFQSGATQTPAVLELRPSMTNLPAGAHTATVTISSSLDGVPSRTVAVPYAIQTFTADVYPNINGCAGCHTGSLPAFSGTAQQVYNQLSPYANTNGLPCRLYGTCTHPLRRPNLADIINAWLAAGAPFN